MGLSKVFTLVVIVNFSRLVQNIVDKASRSMASSKVERRGFGELSDATHGIRVEVTQFKFIRYTSLTSTNIEESKNKFIATMTVSAQFIVRLYPFDKLRVNEVGGELKSI